MPQQMCWRTTLVLRGSETELGLQGGDGRWRGVGGERLSRLEIAPREPELELLARLVPQHKVPLAAEVWIETGGIGIELGVFEPSRRDVLAVTMEQHVER